MRIKASSLRANLKGLREKRVFGGFIAILVVLVRGCEIARENRAGKRTRSRSGRAI